MRVIVKRCELLCIFSDNRHFFELTLSQKDANYEKMSMVSRGLLCNAHPKKSKKSLTFLKNRKFSKTWQYPIYRQHFVDYIFGHWQASWSPLQSNKMKALPLAYKLLFILSKNIVPSQSYRCLKMDVYSEI